MNQSKKKSVGVRFKKCCSTQHLSESKRVPYRSAVNTPLPPHSGVHIFNSVISSLISSILSGLPVSTLASTCLSATCLSQTWWCASPRRPSPPSPASPASGSWESCRARYGQPARCNQLNFMTHCLIDFVCDLVNNSDSREFLSTFQH